MGHLPQVYHSVNAIPSIIDGGRYFEAGFWLPLTVTCCSFSMTYHRDVVSVSTSRSRDGLQTQSLGLVSTKNDNVSVSGGWRLGLVSVIYVSCPRRYFRPNYASHINEMSQVSSRHLWHGALEVDSIFIILFIYLFIYYFLWNSYN